MRKEVIDESLVLFRGRLKFYHYIPSKQRQFGIKFFILCDCETGYFQEFVIYSYSASAIDVDKDDPLEFSGAVFWGQPHPL